MSKIEAMIEKVKALINAPSCCAEAKEAANKWLEAVNTEKQDEAAKALIEEIAADIIPIDGLIAFAGSEDGKKIFGEDLGTGAADAFCGHVIGNSPCEAVCRCIEVCFVS